MNFFCLWFDTVKTKSFKVEIVIIFCIFLIHNTFESYDDDSIEILEEKFQNLKYESILENKKQQKLQFELSKLMTRSKNAIIQAQEKHKELVKTKKQYAKQVREGSAISKKKQEELDFMNFFLELEGHDLEREYKKILSDEKDHLKSLIFGQDEKIFEMKKSNENLRVRLIEEKERSRFLKLQYSNKK